MTPQPKYEVLFYVKMNGECPMDGFLDALPVKVRAKIAKWIELLEEEGPDLPRPYADLLWDKIRELRVKFGPVQYRQLHDVLAEKYFHAFFKAGVYVGLIRTRLGLSGWERNGPREAAKELLRVIQQQA